MASTAASIGARLLLLFSPTVTSSVFVLGLALFLALIVVLCTAIATFAVIAYTVGRKTRFQPVTLVVGSRQIVFDEMAFFPILTSIGLVAMNAFQQFFASVTSTGRSIVEFIINNPRRILAIVLLSGFIAVFLISPELIFPVLSQAWNCFAGPFTRVVILPISSIIAYLASNALLFINFTSRLSKTATTSAIVHAVVGAAEQVTISFMLLGSAALEFGIAQNTWINQTTPSGEVARLLVIAPDFNKTGHLLGDAIYNLRTVTLVACAPLQPYLFEPLLGPFDEEEFAAAINNTLNLLYVPLTQGLIRPIAQYLVNLDADPGGSFGDIAPLPSLNSTIDTLNNAQRNWTRFGDAFIPSVIDGINVLLQDITGLPLPDIAFPRRGPLTLFVSGPLDIILRAAKLTQNLIFQLIFNPDVALSYPDGIAVWKIDEILDGILEYTDVITDYTDFISDYLRALGENFEAELTDPLSAEHTHRMPATLSAHQYIALITEGELINGALQFVADIIDKVPCVILKIAEAIVSVLKLANDLLVGTLYSFLHSAFGGERVASPFEFAQSLYRTAPRSNIQCRVQSTTLFTVPLLHSCPDYQDAVAACLKPVFNNLTMQYDLSAPAYSTWQKAPQSTINFVGSLCSMQACTVFLVFANNGTTIPAPGDGERYAETIDKILAPFACLIELLAKLCVGTDCPFSTETTVEIFPALRDLLLLPINLVVHTDRVVSTAYVARNICFEIDLAGPNIQQIFRGFTNAIRRILNAIISGSMITPCDDATSGSAPSSSFVPCCILNFLDAIVGFSAEILRQVTIQVQSLLRAFLPSNVAGQGLASYTPPPFFFSTGWIMTAADALACVPVQLIPSNLVCNGTMASVRTTAQSTLSTIAFEVLVLIPRLAVNAINGLLTLVLSPTSTNFNALLISLLNPFVDAFGNILFALGSLLECVDSTNVLSTTFIAIANFITMSLDAVLPVIIDLGVAAFQFVVGVFALFTGDVSIFFMAISNFALAIVDNFNAIIKAFAGILISLLGQSFICSIADAICFVSVVPNPAIDNSSFVQACNEGLGTSDPMNVTNQFGFAFCTDRRKRSAYGAVDCFQFLANYGYDRAESKQGRYGLSGDDQIAVDCYDTVSKPNAIMEYLMYQQKAQNIFTKIVANAPAMITEHWQREASRADERIEQLYQQQRDHDRVGTLARFSASHKVQSTYEIDFGMFRRAFVDRLSGDSTTAQAFERKFIVQRDAHSHAKRALESFPRHSNAFFNLFAAFRHLRDVSFPTLNWREAKHPVVAHVSKRSVGTRPERSVAIGGHLVRHHLRKGYERALDRLGDIARSALDRVAVPKPHRTTSSALDAARRIDAGEISYTFNYVESRGYRNLAHWADSGDLVAPLSIDVNPDVLPALGLPECDEMEQILCTQCKYIDDLILVSEKSVRAGALFYSTPGTARGTIGYLNDQFEKALNDVLVDPGGSDTYSTEPRSTLFITTRIWEIRWLWQWDYSEFLDLVNSPVDCDSSDPLADVDIDQGFKDAFNELFGDLIPLAQQFICRVTVAPAETATRLVERYIMCDYDEALFGVGNKGSASIDGPQQIVDGLANSLLILALIGLVIEMFPGGSVLFMMIAPFVLWFGTFWIGYGASPFCLLPGPMQLIGAYPITVPMDAYGLLASTLAPSTPFPFALIDPAFQTQYSTVKITTCGDPPPVVNCAEAAGFDGIYDNIFFTTGVLFGDDFNEGVADTLGMFSDAIRDAALEFTEEHIAELEANNNVGDVCNRLTFVRALFGLLGLIGALIAGIVQISFLIPFIVFIALFTVLVLFLANELASQANVNYVEDDRIDEE